MRQPRWIGIVAAVLALGCVRFASAAEADTKNAEPQEAANAEKAFDPKHPAPWLEWGADLRLRYEYETNVFQLNERLDEERSYFSYRPRLWTKVSPTDWLELNARLTWEPRSWFHPDSREGFDDNQGVIDALNLQLKNIGGVPLTLTAGRQDLFYGDGWLVREGTPLDGTTTYYFDAAKLSYEWKAAKTVIDAVYVQNYADSAKTIRPFGDEDTDMIEQNETGVILYATNKGLEKTQVDGYFIFKNDRKVSKQGNDAKIYTYGARIAGDLSDHWKYLAEGAVQTGRRNGRPHRAFGFNGDLAYLWNDAHKNSVHAGFEYLSGDNPSGDTDTGWDTVWGRWTRCSRLYTWTLRLEEGDSRWTNLERFNVGWSIEPLPRTTLALDYHLLLAPENPYAGTPGFSHDGHLRGHLFTGKVEHEVNKHLALALLVEHFRPGNYYSDLRDEPAMFYRAEATLKW